MGTCSSWVVQLLGSPHIAGCSGGLRFPRAGFVLISELVYRREHVLTRETAASFLWEHNGSRTNLRQLLLRIRKAAPCIEDVLRYDETAIWLDKPHDHVDAAAFERMDIPATADQLDDLLTQFAAPLLDGIDAPSHESAASLNLLRTRKQGKFIALLEVGAKNVSRYGSMPYSGLKNIESALLAADPQREASYKTMIDLYGATGRALEARRILDLLRTVRKTDEDLAPSLETRISAISAAAPAFGQAANSPAAQQTRGAIQLPRIALLAPRWINGGSETNIHRLIIEDVANELARYKSFIALAAHSTFIASHDGGILTDNSKLRADYTVSSFVRPDSDKLGTLCLRLVNCATASIVWTTELALSHELLSKSFRRIVSLLGMEVTRAVERDVLETKTRTGNSSAYFAYLQAQDVLKACNLKNVRRARKAYSEAVKEDGSFAEAYAGLSSCNYFEWLLLGGWNPKLLADARELADLAIAKGPTSSSGYWQLATVSLHQHDFDTAEENYQRSRNLHPNNADIILSHSDAIGHVGDPEQAWVLFQTALDLNPTPPDHYWWSGAGIAFSNADYGMAIELCNRVRDDESVLRLLAACHGKLGNRQEAQEYGKRLQESYPGETAESMTRLQPHKTRDSLETFIDGLRLAGIK